MDIVECTHSYERWLAGRMRLNRADLRAKHAAMASDPFSFFRATFYRWAGTFASTCPRAAASPRLLGVGDIHVENFGTWRDAKALTASAWDWATRGADDLPPPRYEEILRRAIRTPDPFLQLEGPWVIRRLSPYCGRIELSELPRRHEEERLLRAMGCELANVHLGSPAVVPAVLRNLKGRKPGWLQRSSARMERAVIQDWKSWRRENPA